MSKRPSSARASLAPAERARGVTAILGPTNTGKTHLAIERLVAHGEGMIGLPLRLLAREVYQRVVEKVGAAHVALITGEEKIKPPRPRYWICTIEAMPRDISVAFCAIDEIQLAADFGRGHVFTDRLLNMRGRDETLIIGSLTMKPLIQKLLPGAEIVTRPRLSTLMFAGGKKITRLPPRSAIVAFSVEEVYAVAELIRRQKGGAAVVLGALSPRTRNAQVEMFQSGEVDYLVATDAIGMGLNLDLHHVAFASDRKFDGFGFRRLNPSEFGQIAGRAGRYMRDGTFGTTGRCPAFEPELAEAIEEHRFDPMRVLQWRNPELNFRSVRGLLASLAATPKEEGLTRAQTADDMAVLEALAGDIEVAALVRHPQHIARLWDVCQTPDYRKVSPHAHADLVSTIFRALMRHGSLDETWFGRQIAAVDRTDGDIDALSARIAQVRTWTYVANRPDWLADPEHWQERARQVEDKLSDALHERLASRFVDRRTSVLMRRLRENAHMEAVVTPTGEVSVEGQHVGNLRGLHFVPDPQADGSEARALRAAAQKSLGPELEARAERVSMAVDEAFVLSNDGSLRWLGDIVAKLAPGDKLLEPRVILLADDMLAGEAREKAQARVDLWVKSHIAKLLGALTALEEATDIEGLARGVAFQVVEALGVLERAKVAQDVKALDQNGRAQLRKYGLRFGAYHIYLPALLKPAPRALAVQLWVLKHGGSETKGLDELPHLAASGRTSIVLDPEIGRDLYRAAGFRVCGARAVRVDILERLADLIRPAVTYRPGVTPGEPPAGAADGDGFVVTVAMTSLVGCAGEDFASILRSLNYASEQREGPAITVPLVPRAATAPAEATTDAAATAAVVTEATAASDDAPAETVTEDAGAPAVEAPEATTPAVGSEAPAETRVTEAAPEDIAAPEDVAEPQADEPAAEESGAEEATGEAGPEEDAGPTLLDIWRPQRHQHHRHGRGGRDNAGRGGRGRGGPGGQQASQQDGERGGYRGGQRQGEAGEGGGRRGGDDRRKGGFRGGFTPGQDGGRGDGGRPPRPRHEGQGRQDSRHEARGDQRGDRKPQRAEKQPDPDSPFAKLLALKERMQSSDKKS
ncbi:helicase [Camelimonas fluminis]|uniref:Helicase-related protein n=1 Tax=Camelimonas fluminis TaxID=1576911 RepID=A0ABV7ULP6_9HYPH|nr:helicase-related protein [Camelimonas fluminis]GHE55401.1 helicase [Camelimonas fluminis]